MKIIIIGAGFTGIMLAKKLLSEKNTVTLIDNDIDAVTHAANRLDCDVVHADGNNLAALEEQGIARCDALVAVTDSDEINMISCSLADAVYPDVLKIARVRNYAYYTNTTSAKKTHTSTFANNHRPFFGIDHMIHPDVVAADSIVNAVQHGAISDIVSFGDEGEFEVSALQIEKDSKLDGTALKSIRTLTDKKFIVVYLETKDTESDNIISSLPSGETILHAGDRIGFITAKNDIPSMLELCGTKIDEIKKIGLVGIGKIGTLVADRLLEQEKKSIIQRIFSGKNRRTQQFSIFDTDKVLCEKATERYRESNITVFNGDVTDESFITNEGIDKYNLVICATHNHELNMIICAYLESIGVEKTIALVGQAQYGNIARKLGVDVSIPIKDTLVDSIMSHLHGKAVTGIHTVSNGSFEIAECDIPSTSKFVGKPLKDISSPGEYLVLLIKKPGSTKYELPEGNTMLGIGDHIVLIKKTGDKKILEKFTR